MTDRPSKHPTGRFAMPAIPGAPRSPRVERALTEGLTESAVVPVAEEASPA